MDTLTIIAEGAIKASLQQGLEIILHDLEGDAAIIMVELAPRFSAHTGLDKVLEMAPSGQPILMLSWETRSYLAKDLRWQIAMGYGNVHFAKLPVSLIDIAVTLSQGNRVEDPLAKELGKVPSLCNTEIGGIIHDMNHALHDGRGAEIRWDPQWMPRAKALFGDLPREELIEAVNGAKDPDKASGYFAGRDFSEQVCVDVEGTLLDADCNIRLDVLAEVSGLATTRPITVWTGGDIEKLEPVLRNAGVCYKILPKTLFKGTKVGLVIDDLPQKEFDRSYAVNYDEYRKV